MTQKQSPERGHAPGLTTTTTTATMLRPASVLVCPRCGLPLAWTDLEALRRCAELAHRPGPLRFEDIDLEAW